MDLGHTSMKIALFKHDNFSTWHFRKGLMRELVERGHTVYAICPSGDYDARIESLGVIHIPINIGRSINLLEDMKAVRSLYWICHKEKFDILHNFTVKPNIYGAIAARLAGIRTVVGLVSGLGFVYSEHSDLSHKLLRWFVTLLYKLALRLTDRVWFQNEDDLQFFVDAKLLAAHKAILIRSGGIDLDEYSPNSVHEDVLTVLRRELGIAEDTKVVTMVTRASWLKGVGEFVEASKKCARQSCKAIFLLVGGIDEGPQAVPKGYLEQHNNSSNFKWLGFRTDVKELLAGSDIFVFPSYYLEGIPRSLLEALAMQKPIVTTRSVGCREVVEHGKNGFLIPIKDSEALALAILELLSDSERLKAFGAYSRRKAEKEFDEDLVVARIVSDLYQL